ncbi:hypothetical protein ACFL49_02285, partial [Candidatus Omnitrophota bacterium]
PTRKPSKREDLTPKIFLDKSRQYEAVVAKVREIQASGRAILIGTTSLKESQDLSRDWLKKAGVGHNLLNADNEKDEPAIIKVAGKKGAATVATNMAGRGTDIKLDMDVINAGGLFVLYMELNPAGQRIDRQLMGRAGRQGEPGQTQGYLVLPKALQNVFGRDLTLNEDGSIDLKRHPEVLTEMLAWQQENEQAKYNYRLFQFLIDYIYTCQRVLFVSQHSANAFSLWRESYLITHNVHTPHGYEAFKKKSDYYFELFHSNHDGSEWEKQKKNIERLELRVLGDQDLSAQLPEGERLTNHQMVHFFNVSSPARDEAFKRCVEAVFIDLLRKTDFVRRKYVPVTKMLQIFLSDYLSLFNINPLWLASKLQIEPQILKDIIDGNCRKLPLRFLMRFAKVLDVKFHSWLMNGYGNYKNPYGYYQSLISVSAVAPFGRPINPSTGKSFLDIELIKALP